MSRYLIDPSNVPTYGWRAFQPETSKIISGLSLDDLRLSVLKYREANGLPVENNFRRQLEEQICLAMTSEESGAKCRPILENDSANPPHIRKFQKSPSDLENFAKAVKAVIDAGVTGSSISVPQEDAERRAHICSTCPMNLPIASCWGCGLLGGLYRTISGGKYTSHDGALASCDVCGCDNRTQVHFTEEVLSRAAKAQGVRAEDFPAECWKKPLLHITSS